MRATVFSVAMAGWKALMLLVVVDISWKYDGGLDPEVPGTLEVWLAALVFTENPPGWGPGWGWVALLAIIRVPRALPAYGGYVPSLAGGCL
jgi:hypothetical protein